MQDDYDELSRKQNMSLRLQSAGQRMQGVQSAGQRLQSAGKDKFGEDWTFLFVGLVVSVGLPAFSLFLQYGDDDYEELETFVFGIVLVLCAGMRTLIHYQINKNGKYHYDDVYENPDIGPMNLKNFLFKRLQHPIFLMFETFMYVFSISYGLYVLEITKIPKLHEFWDSIVIGILFIVVLMLHLANSHHLGHLVGIVGAFSFVSIAVLDNIIRLNDSELGAMRWFMFIAIMVCVVLMLVPAIPGIECMTHRVWAHVLGVVYMGMGVALFILVQAEGADKTLKHVADERLALACVISSWTMVCIGFPCAVTGRTIYFMDNSNPNQLFELHLESQAQVDNANEFVKSS